MDRIEGIADSHVGILVEVLKFNPTPWNYN